MNKCSLEGVVLPVETVKQSGKLQEHIFLLNCTSPSLATRCLSALPFFLAKARFFYCESHIVI